MPYRLKTAWRAYIQTNGERMRAIRWSAHPVKHFERFFVHSLA
jgi:hypothetical protein